MKKDKLFKLALAAVFAALSCVATMVIHIPMPATNGYINLGDCAVLLGAFVLGPVYGAAAGGLGSMLADLLLGYAAYAPGTLVIKGLVAVCAALIMRAAGKKSLGLLLGAFLGELVMVLGYFAYESLILGYGMGAAASIPGNAIQGAVGMVLGVLVYQVLRVVPAVKNME